MSSTLFLIMRLNYHNIPAQLLCFNYHNCAILLSIHILNRLNYHMTLNYGSVSYLINYTSRPTSILKLGSITFFWSQLSQALGPALIGSSSKQQLLVVPIRNIQRRLKKDFFFLKNKDKSSQVKTHINIGQLQRR